MSNKVYFITIAVLSIAVLLLSGYAWIQSNKNNNLESRDYVFKTFYSEADNEWYVGIAGYLDNTCQAWNGIKTNIDGSNITITGYYSTSEELKEFNDGFCVESTYPFQDYAFFEAPRNAKFTFKVVEGELPK